MKILTLEILTKSPLHLGDGKADVVIDAELARDRYGIPYVPAKRLKGMLYESAIEMAEISDEEWFTIEDVEKAFGHSSVESAKFIINNLHIPNYEQSIDGWEYLQNKYSSVFNDVSVLEAYTDIRYQTSIDEDGLTKDGSLRNIRVVNAGETFSGEIVILEDDETVENILQYAVKNLRYIGVKRNRGFGHVECKMRKGAC